jgi:hypothetical protein
MGRPSDPSATEGLDEYRLEDILEAHKIKPRAFIAPTIACLAGKGATSSAVLRVKLEGIEGRDETRQLRVKWAMPSVQALDETNGIPEEIITQFAAYGLAFVFVTQYTPWQILSRPKRGGRFDFWMGAQNEQQWGLEVSGIMAGSLNSLHAEKREQLLDNPYGVGGYVAVVRFADAQAIFSFHRPLQGG